MTVAVILITIYNVRVATNPHPTAMWVKEGHGGLQAAQTIHSWVYRKWGAATWELRRKQWDSGLNDEEGSTKRRTEKGQGEGKQTETPTIPEDVPASVTPTPPEDDSKSVTEPPTATEDGPS
jgi:hypothetical protein